MREYPPEKSQKNRGMQSSGYFAKGMGSRAISSRLTLRRFASLAIEPW
jgi:hypothetical protein